MAYDAVGESRRLIASRELTPATRLSRRRRYVPMAVDVSDDIAVTMFARRSVGCNVEETYVLARRGSEWTMLGVAVDHWMTTLLTTDLQCCLRGRARAPMPNRGS